MDLLPVLPIIAGLINVSSTIPRIVALIRDPAKASTECRWRALLPAVANAIWAAYGLMIGLIALPAMCAFGTILNIIILATIVRATRRENRNQRN